MHNPHAGAFHFPPLGYSPLVPVPISQPPIPRQPIGTTFLVAISLLGFVAVIQLLAVVIHYIPLVGKQVADSAAQAQATPRAPAPAPVPQMPQSPSAPVPADLLKAQKLFADADASYRVGDFEKALNTLDQVEALMPGDPSVLLRKSQVLERLDQPAEAVMALEEVLKYPGLPPEIRIPAEKKLAQLAETLGAATPRTQLQPGNQTAYADPAGAEVREDTGLQPGADLGIVDARLRDSKAGQKSLRVAVKSRPDSTIKVQDVKIYIYFYEESADGEVLITDSKVRTEWLSPPVDWSANEPELLDGQYILPDSGQPGSSAANGSPGRKYHGYVVAVYYNNELQDFRSEPSKLAKDFPLPLYLPKENVE